MPLDDLRHMVADIAAREGIAAPARRRSTWKSPEKKQEESEEYGENTVCQVFQKGYMLGDRVVRHAVVAVTA